MSVTCVLVRACLKALNVLKGLLFVKTKCGQKYEIEVLSIKIKSQLELTLYHLHPL